MFWILQYDLAWFSILNSSRKAGLNCCICTSAVYPAAGMYSPLNTTTEVPAAHWVSPPDSCCCTLSYSTTTSRDQHLPAYCILCLGLLPFSCSHLWTAHPCPITGGGLQYSFVLSSLRWCVLACQRSKRTSLSVMHLHQAHLLTCSYVQGLWKSTCVSGQLLSRALRGCFIRLSPHPGWDLPFCLPFPWWMGWIPLLFPCVPDLPCATLGPADRVSGGCCSSWYLTAWDPRGCLPCTYRFANSHWALERAARASSAAWDHWCAATEGSGLSWLWSLLFPSAVLHL